MGGSLDLLGYGVPAGAADSGLGGMPAFLPPLGTPSLDASLHLGAALGGLPVYAPPQGYGDAMAIAQQLFRPVPSAPDPWAGARPISPSDLGLLPMQRPATAAVPIAPAATAENFGWLGLPGARGLSPYDASAALPVTAYGPGAGNYTPMPPFPGDVQRSDVPGGSSGPNEWCHLMPGSQALGFCLYICPSGDVRRLPSVGPLGCPRSMMRHHGFGPND